MGPTRDPKWLGLGLGLVALSAAGCHHEDGVAEVCAGARGLPQVKAYVADEEPTGPWPVYLGIRMPQYKGKWFEDSMLYTDFRKAAAAPRRETGLDARLTVCADEQRLPRAIDCEYTNSLVHLHDARYVMTVRETRTGRVLGTRTYDAIATRCPTTTVRLDRERERDDGADLPDAELAEALIPFAPPSVKEKLARVRR